MAVRTPDPLRVENTGSSTLHIATFADIDDGDTWASGIQGVIGYFANATDDVTSGQLSGIDVSLSGTTFTFNTGEDNRAGLLFVLSKS